ncbi:hypothetical protein ACHAWO_005823, partial [Cyclotella atomus]
YHRHRRASSYSSCKCFVPCTTEGSSFFDGLAAGKEGAETMWQKMGSDCGNIWDFQSDVNSMKGWAFPDSGNWRIRSYNRGARSGADQVVQKYEKRCLDNSPDECNDVGLSAAAEVRILINALHHCKKCIYLTSMIFLSKIAFEYCPPPADDAQAMDTPMSFKATCRSVAYGICKGEVGAAVEANGCSITTSQTLNLRRKCKIQVDSMTSVSHDTVIVIPTQPVSNSRCSRQGSCNSCLCAWVEGYGITSRCFDSCDEPNYPDAGLWICWDGLLNTPDIACSNDA